MRVENMRSTEHHSPCLAPLTPDLIGERILSSYTESIALPGGDLIVCHISVVGLQVKTMKNKTLLIVFTIHNPLLSKIVKVGVYNCEALI